MHENRKKKISIRPPGLMKTWMMHRSIHGQQRQQSRAGQTGPRRAGNCWWAHLVLPAQVAGAAVKGVVREVPRRVHALHVRPAAGHGVVI